MKKKLLSLLALTALSSSAMAEAVAPSLKIGGNTIMNIYAVNQKFHKNGRGAAKHISNDVSDLFFIVSGMASNGIEYKYKINISAISNSNPTITQNYVEFNTKFGTTQIGNVVGVEDSFIKDGITISGGTGGPDGGWGNVFTAAVLTPRGNDNIGDTGYATKIVYITPELFEFLKLGVSFTPTTGHVGDAALNTDKLQAPKAPGQRGFFLTKNINSVGENSVAIGLIMHKQFNNWDINFNGAYIHDDSYLLASNSPSAPKKKIRGVSAYQLGLVVGHKFSNDYLLQVGAGYLDNGKSRLTHKALGTEAKTYGYGVAYGDGDTYKGNSGRAWNIGTALTAGIYKFSTAYQRSTRKTDALHKASNDVISVTADVVPVTGLKFYGEVDFINSKSNETAYQLAKVNNGSAINTLPAKNNHGQTFILGTKLSF